MRFQILLDSSEWLGCRGMWQVSGGEVGMGSKGQITKAQCAEKVLGLSKKQPLKSCKQGSDKVRFAS